MKSLTPTLNVYIPHTTPQPTHFNPKPMAAICIKDTNSLRDAYHDSLVIVWYGCISAWNPLRSRS